MKYIDFNDLSELGLVTRINSEILHPLGLALFRNPDNGTSGGALVADDGVWQYGDSIKKGIVTLSDDEIKDKYSKMTKDLKG